MVKREKESWTLRKTVDLPSLIGLGVLGVGALTAWFDTQARVDTQARDIARTEVALADFKQEFKVVQGQNQTEFTRLSADMTALAVSNGRIETTTEFILQSINDIKGTQANGR